VAAALVFSALLTACATRPAPTVTVPEEMLHCPVDVVPQGGTITDNDVAEIIVALDARGDICAQRLEDVRQWLMTRHAVTSR